MLGLHSTVPTVSGKTSIKSLEFDKSQFVKQSSHTTFGRFYPHLYTVWSLFGRKKQPYGCFFQRNKSLPGFVKYPSGVKYAFGV